MQLNQHQMVKLMVSMTKFDYSQLGRRQSKSKPDSNEAKVQAGISIDRCVTPQHEFYQHGTDKLMFKDFCICLNATHAFVH